MTFAKATIVVRAFGIPTMLKLDDHIIENIAQADIEYRRGNLTQLVLRINVDHVETIHEAEPGAA